MTFYTVLAIIPAAIVYTLSGSKVAAIGIASGMFTLLGGMNTADRHRVSEAEYKDISAGIQ